VKIQIIRLQLDERRYDVGKATARQGWTSSTLTVSSPPEFGVAEIGVAD
jgi:hypothetical protein